jgi:hypothetical protein
VALVFLRRGTLRFADAHYALGHHDRFAFFSKTNLNWKARLEVRIDTREASFLEDAARGTLPSVSWIDPNFSNFNPIGFQPNDDHAPADIKDGQELVLAIYHARLRDTKTPGPGATAFASGRRGRRVGGELHAGLSLMHRCCRRPGERMGRGKAQRSLGGR